MERALGAKSGADFGLACLKPFFPPAFDAAELVLESGPLAPYFPIGALCVPSSRMASNS